MRKHVQVRCKIAAFRESLKDGGASYLYNIKKKGRGHMDAQRLGRRANANLLLEFYLPVGWLLQEFYLPVGALVI